MTPFDAQPKVPPHRARRMLAALLGGLGPDDIGAEENLPTETVERALGDELDRRWRADARRIRENPDRPARKLLPPGDGQGRSRRTRGGRPRLENPRPPRPLPWLPPRAPNRRALWRSRTASGCSPSSTRSRPTSPPTPPTTAAAHDPPAAEAPAPIRRIGDLLRLSPHERAQILIRLTDKDCEQVLFDWNLWARPDQEPPPGDWIVWLILAGRGAGKTRAGAEAVRRWSETFPFVNLIGPTADDVRDMMVLGESGILALLPQRRAPALPRRGRTARMAERRGQPSVLRRGARPAARQAAHEAVVRRTRRLAPPGGVRPGDAGPAARRQAADDHHHHAPANQDRQGARGRSGHDRHPRLDLRQQGLSRAAPSSNASPGATRAASSGGRSCSPRSSRRRRARCGRGR